jgi:hypothetical protein
MTPMFRSARLSLRFLLPLFIAMLALAYAVVPLVDTLTLRWFVRDMDIRAALIGSTIGEPLRDRIAVSDWERVDVLLDRATADERLYALGICGSDGQLLRKSRALPSVVDCQFAAGLVAGTGVVLELPQGPLHAATGAVAAGRRCRFPAGGAAPACCEQLSRRPGASWCPTASPTSTSAATTASSSSARPAAW